MLKPITHYFFLNKNEEEVRLGLMNFPGYENRGFYNQNFSKPTEEDAIRLGIKPSMDFMFSPLNFYDYEGSLLKLFETFYGKVSERDLAVNISGAPPSLGIASTMALHMMGKAPFMFNENGKALYIEPIPRIEKSLEFSDKEKYVLLSLKSNPGTKPGQIAKGKSEIAEVASCIKNLEKLGLVEYDKKNYNKKNLTNKGRLTSELIEIKDRIDNTFPNVK